jgi:hypothetical protein
MRARSRPSIRSISSWAVWYPYPFYRQAETRRQIIMRDGIKENEEEEEQGLGHIIIIIVMAPPTANERQPCTNSRTIRRHVPSHNHIHYKYPLKTIYITNKRIQVRRRTLPHYLNKNDVATSIKMMSLPQ